MDILFVNPVDSWEKAIQKNQDMMIEDGIANQQTPHVGIAYLMSAAQRYGIDMHYVDMAADRTSVDGLLELIEQGRPAIVGLTAFTAQVKTAARIAEKIKERVPSTIVALGGAHAINMAVESLDEFPAIDITVCGEGELILPQLVDAAPSLDKLSKIPGVVTRQKRVLDAQPIEDLDALAYPDWGAFDLSLYPGTYPHRTNLELPMVASRGCVHKCTFCSRTLGDVSRRRSVDAVIAEIEYNVERYGCQSIAFMDETFILGKKWIREFMDKYRARGLHKKVSWSCSTRVNGNSPEFMRELRDAGCYYIFYGLESACEESLERIKKKTKVKDMLDSVRWTKEAGMIPVGAFIIGLPGETSKEVEMAVELGHKLDLYSITFPIATPFPGTELRDAALRGDFGLRMLTDDWDSYSKQGEGNIGVMDSVDFPWEERKRMQAWAYESHPKKVLSEYLERIQSENKAG